MMARYQGIDRPQDLDLDLETLFQTTGRHPRRIETLDHHQDLFHPGRIEAQLRGDLLGRGPQVTVQIQVADDQGGDGLGFLVQFGHMQLPGEMGLQGGLLGIEALEGEGLPFFIFAHRRRHEPVFQKAVPVPFFQG